MTSPRTLSHAVRGLVLAAAALACLALPGVAPASTSLSAPTLTGPLVLGGTLVGAPGTWSGSPAQVTFSFEECTRADCADAVLRHSVGGLYPATQTYGAPLELGRWYRLVVQVLESGVGYTSATSAIVGPVLPHPPTPTTAPTVTASPRDGADAVATTGGWHNGGAPGEPDLALRWQRCDAAGAGCADLPGATATSYLPGPVDVGRRLRVVATGTNAGGSSSAASAPSAPVAPRSTVAPVLHGAAADGEALGTDSGAWNGVSGLDLAYRWERCAPGGTACATIPGATAPTYTAGPLDVGAVLRAVVSASAAGSPATDAATLPSAPIAPRATAQPAVGGLVRDGGTLTATTGSWNGATGLELTYRWLRCDAAGAGCVELAAASPSYAATAADVGATLRVRVTADANGGRASSVSAPTAVVAARAPQAVDPPVLSGTARDGGTLAATDGVWLGTAPLTVGRQWLRCETDGAACVAIPAAGNPTLTLGPADIGHTLRLRVTATNVAGAESGTSAPSGIVAGLPPGNVTLPAVDGDPLVGGPLTAAPGTWSGSSVTLGYQWQRCDAAAPTCTDLGGATTAAYVVAASDAGHRLRVRVTATSAGGTTVATSTPTTVVRTPAAPGAGLPVTVTASFDRPVAVGATAAIVRGRVTGPDVAGRTVEVRLRHAFGGSAPLARGVVGPGGAFAIAVRARVTSVAAVAVLGPGGAAIARMTTAPIRVRPVLRASVTRRGGGLHVAGRLLPGGGPAVRLVWQVRTSPGAAWQAVCRPLAVDRAGRFAGRCAAVPTRGRQHRVAYVAQPGGPYVSAASAPVRVVR